MNSTMLAFVLESWRIEGISLPESAALRTADYHLQWIDRDEVTIAALEEAALEFTGGYGRLRTLHGMNVRVGNHRPPPGGPGIEADLKTLCGQAANLHPYELHQRFEQLHPFLDGNGRVGRLLWLWAMVQRGWSVERGFLHEWYYQSLDQGWR